MQKRTKLLALALLFALQITGNTTENVLESQLPPGTLKDLPDAQKQTVLRVINEKLCNCGCTKGTIAQCRIKDSKCSTAPKLISEVISQVKAGKSVAEIENAIAPPKAKQPPAPVVNIPIRADDPSQGPAIAKVTIVEFSDFECGYCRRAAPVVKRILETYSKDVRFVWKHQPIAFHKNAMPAAEAAEAAREQKKFWQMHDLLFENQLHLATINYQALAEKIGLDPKSFRDSIQLHKNRSRIQEDMDLGKSVIITGTPTFFINGIRLTGAKTFEAFQKVIDQELQKADQMIRQGQKLDSGFYAAIVAKNSKAPAPPKAQ